VAEYLLHMNQKRLVNHAAFWLMWIGSFTVIQSFGFGISEYLVWLVYYLVTLPLFMIHTYLIAYWLVPKYFFNRRFVLFSAWILVLLILASVFELLISNEAVWKLMKPENIQQGNYLNGQNILINGLGNEYIIVVFLSVKIIRVWNSKVGEGTKLMNQKLLTEIELLQYQSYPRFILNVMDRLENLAKAKSSQTSEMIIKLSNLMTNMQTDRKSAKISVKKEIDLIRSYIEIQQMSLPKDCKTEFLVAGDYNKQDIPPFLFFQLVEEGFLVLNDSPGNSEFTIMINVEPKYLLFSVTIWNDIVLDRTFNAGIVDNCRKLLSYFYSENHKLISNFEINFVEVAIEIYL
jgi:hypothetical protein